MPAKKNSKGTARKPASKQPKRSSKAPSLADHERRLVVLEGNQPQLGAMVEQLQAQIRAVADGQVMLRDTLRADLAALDAKFNQLARGHELMQGELSQLSLVVRQIADAQVEMSRELGDVRGELGQVRGELTGVKGRLTGIEGAVREQTDRQEGHEQRLQRLEAGGHGG